MIYGGVYEIVNKINGKKYVGSSVNIQRRWGVHKSYLRKGHHPNRHLQSAWNKYGKGAFKFKVLVYTEPQEYMRLENLLLATPNYEYNIARDGVGSMLGRKHTEKTKRKMSEAQSGENHHQYGKHIPEETKRKMSEAHMGHPGYWKDRHRSAETRRKISEGLGVFLLDYDIMKMKALKEAGHSYSKIAKIFGTSYSTTRSRILGITKIERSPK